MEEENAGTEDPTVDLLNPNRCLPSDGAEESRILEFDNFLADEFVDLQELSGLSDGDLCLSRQLAVTIGMDPAIQKGNGSNSKYDPAKIVQMEEMDQPENKYVNIMGEQHQREQTADALHSQHEEESLGSAFLPKEAVEQFLLGMVATEGENIDATNANTELRHFENSKTPLDNLDCSRCSSATSSAVQLNSVEQPALPPPPPIVISPQDVDHISITLEKNQQCACADCGKLFNSVWYLKQHAVKHSNDRPFKCRFCMKTYKFRSNLYQHKCPERNRLLLAGEFNLVGHPYRRRAYNRSADKKHKKEQLQQQQIQKEQMQKEGLTAGNSDFPPTAISINTSNALFNCTPASAEFISPIVDNPAEANHGMGLLMMGTGTGQMGEEQEMLNCFTMSSAINPSNGTFVSPNFDQQLNQQQKMSTEDSQHVLGKEGRVLSPELIEEYLRRNKHRVFNCRKCKLYFPSREYFSRHLAYHDEMETYKFLCEKCPERFQTEQGLQAHHLQHAEHSPHCCLSCNGIFRSALALRRHKDNWPQCYSPAFGMQLPLFANPIDQFSFVESDFEFAGAQSEDEEHDNKEHQNQDEDDDDFDPESCGEKHFGPSMLPKMLTRKTTRDSGYHGSDTQSPDGSHSPADDGTSSNNSFEHCPPIGQKKQQHENGIQRECNKLATKCPGDQSKSKKKANTGVKKRPLYGADQCYEPSMRLQSTRRNSAATMALPQQTPADRNNNNQTI